jgi:hypothetical protein
LIDEEFSSRTGGAKENNSHDDSYSDQLFGIDLAV